MKILWVNANFLHPTTKGGQIRTLEMLRRLHSRHEIHYAAFSDPHEPEGPLRSPEYSSLAFPLRRRIADKRSPAFAFELVKGLFSARPVAVDRFASPAMRELLERLRREHRYDRAVCDFLVSAAHFPALDRAVLFQHNVETTIWERRAEHAPDFLRGAYLRRQARLMARFEEAACRTAGHVVAVSEIDANVFRTRFGAARVSAIATGVDIEYFAPPPAAAQVADLVFVGSMDWFPNADGITHFVSTVLPVIRKRRPSCSLAVVGRQPGKDILDLAARDPNIRVTGTVPDVRPYLWGAAAAIVPLRIGGGTRLKIYEAMAAGTAVVSTSVGAEGLAIHPGADILIGDTPEQLAGACLLLLEDAELRRRIAGAARELVAGKYSWEYVTQEFEGILESAPAYR